jgi:hypothetical protein
MELSDIMLLVKAGYSRNEIEQMERPANANPEPAPVANTEPIAEPVQTPIAEPVAVAAPIPVPQAQPAQTQPQETSQPTMTDIMQGIAKLTSAVQANAIAQSVIPQGLQNPPTAEDMLAEIIRPSYKERSGI